MASALETAEIHPGLTLGGGAVLGYLIIGGLPGAVVGLGLGAVVARKSLFRGAARFLPKEMPQLAAAEGSGSSGSRAAAPRESDSMAGEADDIFTRYLRDRNADGVEFGAQHVTGTDGMGDDGDDGGTPDTSTDSGTAAPAPPTGGGGGSSDGGDSGSGGSGNGGGAGQQQPQQPQQPQAPPQPPTGQRPAAAAQRPAPPTGGGAARPAPPTGGGAPVYVAPPTPPTGQTQPAYVAATAQPTAAAGAPAAGKHHKKEHVHPAHHHHRK